MLPFLKEREGAASLPADVKKRKPDEAGDYDLLSAVADDILAAVKANDSAMLKEALASLMNYIQDFDQEQDRLTMEGDV